MIQKADPSPDPGIGAAGLDVGASLAKLAVRAGDGSLRFRLVPSHAIEQVAREVEDLRAARLATTGGGASRLDGLLSLDTVAVGEFEAWRLGARALLERQGEPPGQRDLLVSLGTGTALLLSDGDWVRWVGGTALGGGTLLGLGTLLLGTSEFDEIVALARRGDRRRVDLLVSDIYPDASDGSLPLPGDVNAASFAKLARPGPQTPPEPADLAHALVGLVAENVASLCAAVAGATDAQRIVFGGATLRDNAPLRDILRRLELTGRPIIFLENGEYTAATGALIQLEGHPNT